MAGDKRWAAVARLEAMLNQMAGEQLELPWPPNWRTK